MLLFALERGSLKNNSLCISLEQILLWMRVLFPHSIAGMCARTGSRILNTLSLKLPLVSLCVHRQGQCLCLL